MGEERRKYPRFSLNQCIQISFGKETFIDAEAVNISMSGILCSSSVPIDNLDKIFMMIDLPIGNEIKTIQCEGVPMYAKTVEGKNMFGVQFTEISEEACSDLKQYLDTSSTTA